MTQPWTLGAVFVLRHAGFPFDWLEELGFSEAFQKRVEALLDVEAVLVRQAGGTKAAQAVAQALAQGREPRPGARPGPEWSAALARWREEREALATAYAEERAALRQKLRARANDRGVQEAVFLSSPATYENVWAPYLAAPDAPDNADTRRDERLVYTYLQRLCAKSETTSFFGPIAYGEAVDDDSFAVRTLQGPPLKRRTFFAFWAVTELARAVGRERELLVHVPLRRNPIFRFTDAEARCEALGMRVDLTPEARRVLEALREEGTPATLAAALGVTPEAVLRTVTPLLRSAALLRGLHFLADDFATFEGLLAAVRGLPDVQARARWLERLAHLDGLRATFQEGDLDVRRATLPKLEATFTELTGVPARRGEGHVYADRLIIYEEGRSPFGVRMGRRFFESLARRLSPSLELSAAYGERVQRGYRRDVAEKLGASGEPLNLLSYAVKLRPDEVAGSRFSPVPPVTLDAPEGRIHELPEDFCGTASPGGRYALPDVCLAGPPPEGARAEDFQVVLSRVHHHLLLWSWLAAFYPDRGRYESVSRRWLSHEPSARNLLGLSVRRRNKGFYRFPGRRLVYAVTDAMDIDGEALTADQPTVFPTPEGPELRTPDGERAFLYLALDDFSSYPPFAALAHPQVLHVPIRGEGHLPRLTVGGAVYQRERWEVSLSHLPKLHGLELLLAVWRERRAGGWPRFVFVRTPAERKPYLVDTASPFALELLRHVARGAERVTVVEMLPGPESLWLRDARGRYVCELRMQAERWTDGPPAFTEGVERT